MILTQQFVKQCFLEKAESLYFYLFFCISLYAACWENISAQYNSGIVSDIQIASVIASKMNWKRHFAT